MKKFFKKHSFLRRKQFVGAPLITFFLLFFATLPAIWGDETQTLLQKVAEKADGSIVIISWTVKDEFSSQVHGGVGICIARRGWFITPSINTQTRVETIRDMEIILPGPDRKSIKARLLGIDPVTGMSFIQAEENRSWNPISFVRNSELKLGGQVVSLGINHLDPQLALELGMGYISSVSFTPEKRFAVTGGSLGAFGSVVFDSKLRPVGIVTTQPFQRYQAVLKGRSASMRLRSESQGLAFTPVEEFANILSQIPQDGKTRRLPWIGVGGFTTLSRELAEVKGIATPAVMLDRVITGEAAAVAGLKNGDIIVSLNGKVLKNLGAPGLTASEFSRSIIRLPIGTEITLGVLKDGVPHEVKLKLRATPTLPSQARRSFNTEIGLLVREKVTLDRHFWNSPSGKADGLIVLGVGQKSPCSRGGVQQGDLLTMINNRPVQTVKQFEDALDKALSQKSTSDISFVIRRGEKKLKLTIKPPAKKK